MPKCIVIHELAVVKGSNDPSDIYLTYEEQDLGSTGPLTEGIKTIDLVSFYNRVTKEQDLIKGNFYMDKALPRLFVGSLTPVNVEPNEVELYLSNKRKEPEMTVIEIMRTLSELKSEIKFEEHFYNRMTGGAIFDNFTPNFNTARLRANNLIISGKKFNIVLTATIDGLVDMDGATQVFSRFHPFKLVKFGDLNHTKIKVKVDDNNKEFLETGIRTEEITGDGWATINLRDYPIFHNQGATPTLSGLYTVIDRIQSHKALDKAYKYYLTKLQEKIPPNVLDTKDWFRGEPVDDEYISDEGTEYFEVWIKGRQSIISIDKLMQDLPDLGVAFIQLFDLFSDLDEVDVNYFENLFQSLTTITQEYENKRVINKYESIIIRTLIEVLKLQGSKEERYKRLVNMIKLNSQHLNQLELKLLNFRWNLYKMSPKNNLALNDDLMKLGRYEGQKRNSLNLSHFLNDNIVLTFKKDIIEKTDRNPNLTSNFEGIIPNISTDVEGV